MKKGNTDINKYKERFSEKCIKYSHLLIINLFILKRIKMLIVQFDYEMSPDTQI